MTNLRREKLGEYSIIFDWHTWVVYLIIINIIGFFAMGIDKWKAKRNAWRIPENTLFLITLLGGGIGTNIGMYYFRHKTKKWYFRFGFPIILILQILVIIDLVRRFS